MTVHPNVVVLSDESEATGSSLWPALKQTGYNVHVLTVPNAPPDVIARLKPIAVVFDMEHQFTNVYELLAALRKREDLKGALVIGIFSGDGNAEDRHRKDFDHCLVKPVHLDALLSAIDSGRPASYRVLLVEDHAPLADATAMLLRHEGLEVSIAASGKEALEMSDTVRPEIVLCDLRLPDMSGLDVARELRVRPGGKDAFVAIHTAMDEGRLDAIKNVAGSSVNRFLPKPLTQEQLATLIAGFQELRRTA